ncbi:hypothetical protein M406DRAFT_336228 [Cryphonectria parasitica EP155]|uniref:Utp8 beta-propeller domain-containing protein n=1 Tax=Cryphonectria parasitica (strain ATCC 38755 / EP155) TaxID=660469 RepID=A0A9P4YC19_CRYP1|nr:uncharacterized protein M406DRAFT_336228 [Cryphonectria parasitica EP155]KAF3770578.1 hypothetical protein M406DRAFT_336228 [Cryphonectria parasitica EP155]
MAATFNIQKPYVLTTLPRPLNRQGNGSAYTVGDVWGQQQGSKKRKRPELAVGIDGEAVNLYDISSQRLITSYPIPPQSVFTCPPCSTRWRVAKSRDAARYTYVSTRDPKAKITLFKDVLGASGDTTSTIVTEQVDHASKLVHLGTTSTSTEDDAKADLLAVTEDGSVMCFQGEDLRKRWETSPEILRQDLASIPRGGRLEVELVQAALASDVIAGFFGGKQDAFASLLRTSQEDVSAQNMLVLITKTVSAEQVTRQLHILGVVPTDQQVAGRLVQVHTSPIPSAYAASNGPESLRLDINTGSLMELQEGSLVTYDLTRSLAKVECTLEVPDVRSFIRLSKSSVLAAKSETLDVYNPVYQSLQASAAFDLESTSKEVHAPTISLVAYFPPLEIAVAIYGASLVAMQLEAPRTRGKKRRSEGLLIDSIGRGIPQSKDIKKFRSGAESASFSTSFSSNLPGSVSGNYWSDFTSDVQRADELLAANDIAGFEEIIAEKFGIEIKPAGAASGTNGIDNEPVPDQEQPRLPEWILPAARTNYRYSDRRWVQFAISRVFAWRDTQESGTEATRLICRLPQSNLLTMLVDAGHLTVSNLKSAFNDETRNIDDIDFIFGEELPQVLVQVDPVFELLLSYLSSTKLGAVELLTSVRLIMRSLELVQDPTKIAPKLLAFESQMSDAADPDDTTLLADQSAIGHELERAVQELEAAEYFHLGDQSLIRGRSLSVAFGKLSSCPRVSTIRVLRRSYKPEEILSLIYVLRMELVKDGWTTRYLDTTQLDRDDELEAPPDGSISLISDLLCRCIDAVGPGGWLINDAIVAAGAGDHMDSADFLASLKLEVSAALEGVQEAVFLRGIISEAVRYGSTMQKVEAEMGQKHRRVDGASSAMLPLGMKAKKRISAEKVVSGGEVARRRKREVGHLLSQKVGPYSLERISI